MDRNNKINADSKDSGKSSFFHNLFASLFKSSNPDAEKKRKLKTLAKTFSKTKYHAFYKPNSGEVQASFAKLMWEIYKVISQSQLYIKSAQNPSIFKRQIINYTMSKKQLELLEHFDEQKILEMSKKLPLQKIQTTLEEELQFFTNQFDNERMNRGENLFKAFTIFKDFCEYDFYVLLRKFDTTIQEYQFDAAPHFEKGNDAYILEDLKDFLAVAFAITDDTVIWNDLFEMFKNTTGKDLISPNNWKKIVAKIKSIQVSKSLEMMTQLIAKDPEYECQLKYHFEPLFEPYIDKIQTEVHATLDKIGNQQKEDKANSICMQIFGTANPQILNYYVSSFNANLEKKNLDTFEYTEALNYLKTFIVEHVKKEIRELYDVVVIRGQWDAALSAPMSNAYQELLKASEEITIFDESLAEEGALGMKIKTLLPKTAHDQGAENIINRVVSDANDNAKNFLYTSTQNLITIGKTIKQLVEDYSLPKPVLVANWKELEKFIEIPMKEFCVDIYKKIYLFAQLMQQYLQ